MMFVQRSMSWVVTSLNVQLTHKGGKLGAQETLSGDMCGWQRCAPSLRLTVMCTISMFNLRPTDDNDTNLSMSSRFWGGDASNLT